MMPPGINDMRFMQELRCTVVGLRIKMGLGCDTALLTSDLTPTTTTIITTTTTTTNDRLGDL